MDGTSGSVIYFVVEVIVGEKVVIPRLLGDVLNEVFFVGPVGNVMTSFTSRGEYPIKLTFIEYLP